MKHTVIYKRDGWYTSFPQLDVLPDGRLAVGAPSSPVAEHAGVFEWVVLVSTDQGETWTETDDPAIPFNWPGTSPREREDRLATVMPDGSYLCAGGIGHEVWPAERRPEAEEQGLQVSEHLVDADAIVIGGHRLFVQRSTDGGRTWSRREWGGASGVSFSRPAILKDGTILIPFYGGDSNGAHTYVWRSADGGRTFRLLPMGAHPVPRYSSNETAFLEVSPGRVLAHSRTESGYLVERWSEDAGRTWSQPLSTGIWGYPPHLLKLRNGRVLCAYGYRRPPMGVRAAIADDGGEKWDLEDIRVLRDDGGYPNQMRPSAGSNGPTTGGSDLGYPLSTQLPDGSVLTVYYITLADGVTHIACTRWEV